MDLLTVQEKKRQKFYRNKMTSVHQVLYCMRDNLSAKEDFCTGTSADEADDNEYMQSKKLFCKGSFEDLKSTKIVNYNQLEIQE